MRKFSKALVEMDVHKASIEWAIAELDGEGRRNTAPRPTRQERSETLVFLALSDNKSTRSGGNPHGKSAALDRSPGRIGWNSGLCRRIWCASHRHVDSRWLSSWHASSGGDGSDDIGLSGLCCRSRGAGAEIARTAKSSVSVRSDRPGVQRGPVAGECADLGPRPAGGYVGICRVRDDFPEGDRRKLACAARSAWR